LVLVEQADAKRHIDRQGQRLWPKGAKIEYALPSFVIDIAVEEGALVEVTMRPDFQQGGFTVKVRLGIGSQDILRRG
jgi:hypothetical protein